MRHVEYWRRNCDDHKHLPWWKDGVPGPGYGVVTDVLGRRHAVHVLPANEDNIYWVVAKYNTKEMMLKAYQETREEVQGRGCKR